MGVSEAGLSQVPAELHLNENCIFLFLRVLIKSHQTLVTAGWESLTQPLSYAPPKGDLKASLLVWRLRRSRPQLKSFFKYGLHLWLCWFRSKSLPGNKNMFFCFFSFLVKNCVGTFCWRQEGLEVEQAQVFRASQPRASFLKSEPSPSSWRWENEACLCSKIQIGRSCLFPEHLDFQFCPARENLSWAKLELCPKVVEVILLIEPSSLTEGLLCLYTCFWTRLLFA